MSDTILLLLIRSLATCFEIMLAFVLLNGFLTPAYKSRWQRYITIAAMIVLMFITSGESWASNLHIPIEILLLFLSSLFLYAGKIRQKLIYNSIYAIYLLFSNLLSFFIISQIPKDLGFVESSENFFSILNIVVPKLILLSCVLLSLLFVRKRHWDMTFKYWLLLLSVPMITLIILSVLQYYISVMPPEAKLFNDSLSIVIDDKSYEFPTIGMYGYILGSVIGLIFINILVFTLFAKLQSQLEMKRRFDVLEKQTEIQSLSINKLENSYSRMREFRHDLQNHLVCLSALVEQKKYDELHDYIKTMVNTVDEAAFMTITGISAVDAILNEKLVEANKNRITTLFDVPRLEDISVEPIDLCIILSNALDNAVEACRKIEESGEKFIKLKIGLAEEYIILSCTNPVDKEPEMRGMFPVTDKKDRENHGLGLKSIQNTAKKYSGECMTRCADKEFTIIVKLNYNKTK